MVTDFGAALQEGLAQLREFAESRMRDTVLVETLGGRTPGNDATGKVGRVWVQAYSGKCRWQQRSQTVASPTVAGGTVTIQQTELHLPVADSASVTPNDGAQWRATVTACVNDPSRVGRVVAITGDMWKSDATARRLICQEA